MGIKGHTDRVFPGQGHIYVFPNFSAILSLMSTDRQWHTMTDGDWHPIHAEDEATDKALRQGARNWGLRFRYRASVRKGPEGLQVRFTPYPGAATATELARFGGGGEILEPTREQEARCREAVGPRWHRLTPEAWTALMDAGERRDGMVSRFAKEGWVIALQRRNLIAYRSLTPKALRVLGRDAEADHLVSVGAECLADLHDRTFVPGSQATPPKFR